MGGAGALVVSPPLNAPVRPTIASGLKSAGDAIGQKLTLSVPSPILSDVNGPIALIETVVFKNAEQLNKSIGLYISNVDFFDVGDGAAMAITVSELDAALGIVSALSGSPGDWTNIGTREIATVINLGMSGKIIGGQLFVQFFAIEDVTFASADSLKATISGLIS